eukprot:XP_027301458.1 uncharacterized protein LOC101804340 [Anas platyrhynchos]
MAGGLGPRLLALALALGPAGVWTQLSVVESGGGLRAPGDSVHLSCQGSGFTFGSYPVWWYRQARGGSLEWLSAISSGVCAELMLVESGGRLRVPGESVHLSCWGSDFNFAIYSVLWYRQALGGSLQWLSYINPDSSYIRYGSAVKGRATASRDNSKSKTALTLNNLHLQDSARYFCAVHTGTGNLAELCLDSANGAWLDPPEDFDQAAINNLLFDSHFYGVYGFYSPFLNQLIDTARKELFIGLSINSVITDKLVFGSGTTLTVEPSNQKESDPEVVLIKSKAPEEGGSTGKAACLARNFYPKNISLDMLTAEVIYEQSPPIMTSEGTYNTIKVVNVAKKSEVSCTAKFKNKNFPANATSSEKVVEEPITANVCNTTDISSKGDIKTEKTNMLSMAVLGLRVLLAKSIAFNTLMSIKLFLF